MDDETSNSDPFQEPFEQVSTDPDQLKRTVDNIKFEADDAAALLPLKRHRESQS